MKIFMLMAVAMGFMFGTVTSVAASNEFSTLERVEFVLGCMKKRGGENYDNLYRCSCMIDKIAEQFTPTDYFEARTYSMLRSTAGERGSAFRDPPQAKSLVKKLNEVNEAVQKACLAS